MRKVANGSAPGPSGWTGELIKALVGDADCLAGLVALVEDIINGDLDDSARKFLLSSSLIASEKDSGGFRPIAIGDVFTVWPVIMSSNWSSLLRRLCSNL